MDYRLAIVVVACIALAGCSMGGESDTPTPSLETVDYPDGFSENGTASSASIVENHTSSMLETSNYSVRWQFVERKNGSIAANSTITGQVSPATRESRFEIQQRGADGELVGYHQEAYFTNGTRWSYSLESDRLLSAGKANFTGSVVVYGGALRTQFSTVTLAASGVEQRNGVTVITYDVTGLTENGTEKFDSASGTVSVTESGRLVSVELTATRGANSQTFRYLVTNVGQTAVDRPAWVDEAA